MSIVKMCKNGRAFLLKVTTKKKIGEFDDWQGKK